MYLRYVGELSPAKYRGRMIGLDYMCIMGKWLVSYGVGVSFAHVRAGWRCHTNHHLCLPILLGTQCSPGRYPSTRGPRRPRRPSRTSSSKTNGTYEQVRRKIHRINDHVNEDKNLNARKSRCCVLKRLCVVLVRSLELVSRCGVIAVLKLGGLNSWLASITAWLLEPLSPSPTLSSPLSAY